MVTLIFILIGKSVKTGILLSLFIPGGGQFYTENYLKGVVFAGSQGYLLYQTYYNYKWYKEARDGFLNGGVGEPELNYRRAVFYDTLWWDGLVWFLALIDTYVDVKLYRFKTLPDIGFNTKRIELRWYF